MVPLTMNQSVYYHIDYGVPDSQILCIYTSLSMPLTQKCLLAPVYHLLCSSSEDVVCQHTTAYIAKLA